MIDVTVEDDIVEIIVGRRYLELTLEEARALLIELNVKLGE